MKINVVTVRSGWILQKIAERIVANAPVGVDMKICHNPVSYANNFYVDIQNCYKGRSGGKDVGLFTHVHENNMKHIPTSWFCLDYIIHMSRRSLVQFTEDPRFKKFLPPMMTKMPGEIPPGFEYRKPTIGVFQRGKFEGKGYSTMQYIANTDVAKDFYWIFVGSGWGGVAEKLNAEVFDDTKVDYPLGYLDLYNRVDYVLIPSRWEGGPMSLIEAASLGKEIISADVGWAGKEIKTKYLYNKDNPKALEGLLANIIYGKKQRRQLVEKLSYQNYVEKLVELYEDI